MAQNKAGFVKAQKKGGGPWKRKGRRARKKDSSGSDDPSDEEYVAGLDEEECESSPDSYSSDASKEASLESGGASSFSDEEDEDLESEDSEDEFRGGRRRIRSKSKVERRRTRKNRRISSDSFAPGEELGPPSTRRTRAVVFPEEEDEYDDKNDEDFAPDEDEEPEEESAKSPIRKPTKNQSKQSKPSQRKKILSRRRNTPVTPISDDEDLFVEETNNNRTQICSRKGRKSRVIHSDSSGSDSSDLDFKIKEQNLGDLPSSTNQKKGKGVKFNNPATQICGICLSEERKEIIRGLLDCCSHFFCFSCIIEWSKVESKCPVCKRRFNTVSRSTRSEAGFCLRTAVVRIPKRDQVYQPSEEEIRGYLDPYANVVCVECQQGGDDNLMLLCDLCDSPSHTYCVGLGREVPEGNWYCNGCRSTDQASSNAGPLIQENFQSEIIAANPSPCRIHEHLSQIPSEGISNSSPSGITASTLFGRRSIHQRIRIMLLNDRNRRNPEEFAHNSMMPDLNDAILMNGRDESSSRLNLWSFNEGGSIGAVESVKEHVQS